MLTVFGAMAELERENILERQREGIAIAKEQGLYQGRQKMKIDKEHFEAVVKEWRADKITAVEAMKRLDVKPNTFYRRVKGAVSLKGSPPKKQRPGSCVEPGFGVLFRCETKQNASRVYSKRD